MAYDLPSKNDGQNVFPPLAERQMSVTEGTFVAPEDGLPGRVHGYVVSLTMVIVGTSPKDRG